MLSNLSSKKITHKRVQNNIQVFTLNDRFTYMQYHIIHLIELIKYDHLNWCYAILHNSFNQIH